MKPQPNPNRFSIPELQQAYEHGFNQEYDHDSFTLLDRFQWLADDAESEEGRGHLISAMLEGASAALDALAREYRCWPPASAELPCGERPA